MAFRNVRLQVELAAQVDQLDERTRDLAASRRRLIDAGDTERRRLESALAREVLPAMTSLRADLAAAPRRRSTRPRAATYVDRATAALEALRELTRGIYPDPAHPVRPGRRAHVVRRPRAAGRGVLSVDPGRRERAVRRAGRGGGVLLLRRGARRITDAPASVAVDAD